MKNKHYSQEITVFHGKKAPEKGKIAGYGAIIEAHQLNVPMPECLMLISHKNRKYATSGWQVFTSRHEPEDILFKHLSFALKYEGVNLLVLVKLFTTVPKDELTEMLKLEPFSKWTRKLWFLYEWLMKDKLDIPDLTTGNYIPVIDEKQQYTIKGVRDQRQRVINNLPGTVDFCPLITRTKKLDHYLSLELSVKNRDYVSSIHSDILQRTSAFLLLKDSRASFTIEGESPKSKRAAKWGQVIGQAGSNFLTKEELIRLQEIVIENARFVEMGFREKGGFVGAHNRTTGYPIPDHISARWQDVDQLINGLLNTHKILQESEIDAVLAAAIIAFGFVFIHPFEDGNGRIHRYLIHHVLAEKKFSQQGIIFPISAAILDCINDYREVLQSYSHPVLEFVEWEETPEHNIEVLNDTIDFYRYFDATRLAEFLYECVEDTMTRIIPEEVRFLQAYDEFKRYIDEEFEMPDRMVALLVRFLEQNGGKLSNRARAIELKALTDSEIIEIEKRFVEIFRDTV